MGRIIFFITWLVLFLWCKGAIVDSSSESIDSMDTCIILGVDESRQGGDQFPFMAPSQDLNEVILYKSKSSTRQLNLRNEKLVRPHFSLYKHQRHSPLFTSSRSLCWTYASEHYVFALRHLLI